MLNFLVFKAKGRGERKERRVRERGMGKEGKEERGKERRGGRTGRGGQGKGGRGLSPALAVINYLAALKLVS